MGPTGPTEEIAGDPTQGPLEYGPLDDLDGPLLARQRFPELDFYRLSWGYLCVPGGSVVFAASDVPSLVGN